MEIEELKPEELSSTMTISCEDTLVDPTNISTKIDSNKIKNEQCWNHVDGKVPIVDTSRITTITLVEIESSISDSEPNDICTPMDEDDKNWSIIREDVNACTKNTLSPISVAHCFEEKRLTELSRYSWRGSSKRQRFLKGCLWSPDGTCILTTVNCEGMHIIELPQDLYATESVSSDRPLDILQSAVHIKEGGIVYDYCWYPFMNSNDPASCCWLASRQHEPIQMWDAYKGNLRCSYRGYNAVDEVESALSVTFSFDGSDVIGGYKNSLRIFKTDVPGRDYNSISIKSPASALAVNPTDNTISVGSWTGSISLIDARNSNAENIGQSVMHKGGITYLKFLPRRNQLLSGARKDGHLFIWDLRQLNEPILELKRTVHTNQRIYFDVNADENWIVSGDTMGIMHAWNINDFSIIEELTLPVHHDCCNGVTLHPTKPILATSSGQHHFELVDEDTNSKGINTIKEIKAIPKENSLIFWWCGKSSSNYN